MHSIKHRSHAKADRRRRGGVLPYMTIIIFALMAVTLAFQTSSLASNRGVKTTHDDLRAKNLLDAAIAESITAASMQTLGTQAAGPGGTPPTPGAVGSQAQPAYLAGGLFWVESTPLGGDRYQLNATAMVGSGRAAAEVVVEVDVQDPLFSAVLNSDEQLTLNSDVMIDSYDSFAGTYASQVGSTYGIHSYAADNGDVTSNEGIVLNSNATVFGDATPGIGYGVSFANGSYVSGATNPTTTAFNFPPIAVPPTPITGNLTVNTNGSQTLGSGSHGLGTLSIGKSATLTIQGPADIVVSDFIGGKDGNLVIDATNGPVTFYVTNSYTHNNGFEALPAPGSPMAVAFMMDMTQDIIFPSATKVRGAYYAPNANITFTSNNEAWGSFGANRIDMSSSMKFHYDEELSKHWQGGNGGGGNPVSVLAWSPDELGGSYGRDRRDPFRVLGVTAGQLPPPNKSW